MFDNARYSIALCLGIFLVSTTTASGQCLTGHLFASDGAASDIFGVSVAISGHTAIVGAGDDDTPRGTNAGSAYVFVRSGGVWMEQAHLFASDGAAGDLFGASVAVFGDTVVVGAWGDNTPAPGGANAGSAYVFVRDIDGVWTQQAHLFAYDGAAGDEFGLSVAISGDTVVVTAHLDDTPAGINAGSAYVFMRSGTAWDEQAHLLASDGAGGDSFGSWSAIATTGDTIVLGAQLDDTLLGGVNAGSSYVFERNGEVWTEQAQLFASDGAPGDNFGYAVEISGDTVVVGAFADDTPAGGTDAGSAYVFVRDGDGWTEQAHLFASDGAAGDRFTSDIAIFADTVVVGASRDDTSGGVDAGSAYVFERNGGVWMEHSRIFALNGGAGDLFGYSVEMSGDTAIVGAHLDNTPDGTDAGSVCSYDVHCCPCDVDGSGSVDLSDLTTLLSNFGTTDGPSFADGDLDADGDVDLSDLTNLLSNFGSACE